MKYEATMHWGPEKIPNHAVNASPPIFSETSFAKTCAKDHKKAPERIQLLKASYEEEFDRAMAEDRDRSSFTITPSLSYYKVG